MLTRFDVDPDRLATVLEPLGRPVRIEPLTGGLFATVLRVTLAGGREVVAKVVPSDETHLMSYERGLLRTEGRINRDLAGSGVPVPVVLLEDHSRTAMDADVLVSSFLPGATWRNLALTAEASSAVVRRLGAVMAAAHRVTGEAFGYPAPEAGMLAADWPTAFALMVGGVLADAERWHVPVPAERALAAVERHRGALAEVARPAVVHNDLWSGNVLLDEDLRIVGITDTERTVWADPLLDLVGADQFGTFSPDPALLDGDAAAGGRLALDLASPSGLVRYALYRVYYSLVLLTEITVRGYIGEQAREQRAAALSSLDPALRRLGV